MTKSQIIDQVAANAGLKKKDAEASVNAFIEAIEGALVNDDKVQIVGFGTFEVKKRKARVGINPQTKSKIDIPESNHISFIAGKSIKDKINK